METFNVKQPIILYGVSMVNAAILKAIAAENIEPDAIILGIPFARFIDVIKKRLKAINIPSLPLAEMLIFWSSIHHGFNGLAHNPVTYAQQVRCTTLLLQGKEDKLIDMAEINELFQNLQSQKQLVTFPAAGHQLLVTVDKELWQNSVENFLKLLVFAGKSW